MTLFSDANGIVSKSPLTKGDWVIFVINNEKPKHAGSLWSSKSMSVFPPPSSGVTGAPGCLSPAFWASRLLHPTAVKCHDLAPARQMPRSRATVLPQALCELRGMWGEDPGLGTPLFLPNPHLPSREVLHPRTGTTPSFVPGCSLFQDSYVILSPELAHVCGYSRYASFNQPNSTVLRDDPQAATIHLTRCKAIPCPYRSEHSHQCSHWLIADL